MIGPWARSRRLLDVVGGRYAVTMEAWLLAAPLAIGSTLIPIPGMVGGNPGAWIALALAGHIAGGGLLWVAHSTYLAEGTRRSRPLLAIATFAIVGVLRAFVLGFGSVATGLAEDPLLAHRLPIATLLATVWFAALAVIVTLRRDFQDETRTQRGLLERLTHAKAAEAEVVSSLRDELTEEIDRVVTRRLAFIANSLAAQGNLETALHLHDLVDDAVKPLSRDLAQRTNAAQALVDDEIDDLPDRRPVARLRAMAVDFGAAFTQVPNAPAFIALFWLMGPLWTITWRLGLLDGLLAGCLSLALLAGLLWLGRRACRRLRLRSSAARVGCAVSTWIVITAIQSSVFAWITGLLGEFPNAFVWSFTWSFSAILGCAMLLAALDRAAQIQRSLQSLVDEADWAVERLRLIAWDEQRRLSRLVHSDVQARITAAAIRLQTPGISADDAQQMLTALVGEVIAILDRNAPLRDSAPTDLDAVLAVWHGAVDIHCESSIAAKEQLALDSVANDAVVDVVREAITNAANRGGAQHVWIEIELDERYVRLTVANDGVLGETGRRGLGSVIMDERCARWTLESTGMNTQLRAWIATTPNGHLPGAQLGRLNSTIVA